MAERTRESSGGSPPVREERLDNGLKVLLRPIPGPGVVSLWCWYRVGSRDERPGITGIAHWVEHMNFKGTEAIPKEEIKNRIELVGGAWNGYTFLDVTTYLETVPTAALPQMIELEAERMARCLYDTREVDRERTVVISELEGGENNPVEYLDREVIGTALQAHPYRWPTIGYRSDLEAITRDDLQSFYRHYYVPNNATVVITGDFDPDTALSEVKKRFGPIPPGEAPPPIRTREPEQHGERRVMLRRPGTTAYLQVAFHAPAISDPDFFPLVMADAVLAGGRSLNLWSALGGGGLRKSSRLYRALVDSGLATEVSTGLLPTTYPFLYSLQATVRRGSSIDAVEAGLLRELERLAADTVGDRELERARNQVRARYVFDSDSVTDLAHQLGFFETIDSWRTFFAIPERIGAVTAEDVRRVARTLFSERRRTVGRLYPAAEAPGAAGSGGGVDPARFRARRLRPAAATAGGAGSATTAIRPTRHVLANGLAVLVHSQPAFPSLTARLAVRAGSMRDPRGRAGAAYLTAKMLDRGTGKRSMQELAEAVDHLGATFARDVDAHAVTLASTMLPEHLPEMLDFLQEIARTPVFPAAELDKARQEVLTAIDEEDDDPTAVAHRALHEEIYPEGHPYRHPILGLRGEVESIRREDLIEFHRAGFRPDAAFLVVVGPQPQEEILREVERRFGDWEAAGAAPRFEVGPVDLPSGGRRRAVAMPTKSQVEILLGFRGLPRNHPDFYPALLMSHVLGQFGMGGRIGRRIRDTEGLAYYAFCHFVPGIGPGPFIARMGVNPERAERAIELLREELHRMKREGAGEDEIDNSRRYLTGALALRLETNEGIAHFLANAELYGLGADFHRRYAGILAAVTPDQVRRAAAEHLHPQRAALVLAGPIPPEG